MLTTLKRIIKSGWENFYRSSTASVATVFILAIVIFVTSSLFIIKDASNYLVEQIKDRTDVSVYLIKAAPRNRILNLKEEVYNLDEVSQVDFISQKEAYNRFVEEHDEDPDLMGAIDEVGGNPFLASLSIRAKDHDQYAQIAQFIEESEYSDIVEKIDYYQRKPIIEKIFSLTATINKVGFGVGLGLIFIFLLVTFNTIQLAIYNSNEEISVMKLVGASNWFIRGSFIIQGMICGLAASLASMLLLYITSLGLNGKIEGLLGGFSLYSSFLSNFWILLGIQLLLGLSLSALSSYIAVKRHLN